MFPLFEGVCFPTIAAVPWGKKQKHKQLLGQEMAEHCQNMRELSALAVSRSIAGGLLLPWNLQTRPRRTRCLAPPAQIESQRGQSRSRASGEMNLRMSLYPTQFPCWCKLCGLCRRGQSSGVFWGLSRMPGGLLLFRVTRHGAHHSPMR